MATQVKRLKMEHDGASVQDLSWDHQVQLIGEKVNDPDLLNCCMVCGLPILIYGRMIPCKHVLCMDCAKKHSSSICAKCGDKVTRIEPSPLGTVFVCSFGSSRHGPGGCKRTYLSYRDMEAHIKHRHKKKDTVPTVAVQPMAQAQILSLSQPPPNMAPPHQYMGVPTHMPPHSHMVNHPPPGIIPTTNVPPPGLSVSLAHVHTMQSNAITMQGNMTTMQNNPHIRQGPGPVMMQAPPQNTLPPRHPIPPVNQLPGHHTMIGGGPPPAHPMQPHQQMQGGSQSHAQLLQQQRQGVPQQRQQRPPGGPQQHPHMQGVPQPHQPRPLRHVMPQQPHNQPVGPSTSHGNLISIPIQGSPGWAGPGQQQWSNQGQQQHHR